MVGFVDDSPLQQTIIENSVLNMGKLASEGRVIQKGEGVTDCGNKTVQENGIEESVEISASQNIENAKVAGVRTGKLDHESRILRLRIVTDDR